MTLPLQVQIRYVEGFEVKIDRSPHSISPGNLSYPYQEPAHDKITVKQWQERRVEANFDGLEVDVLNGQGVVVSPQTLLRTVRNSY